MDQKDIHDLKGDDLEKHIPIIGKHLSAWKDVKTEEDAVIFRLSGLSNITCLVKAKSKSVSPRYVIFRVFDNDLCETEVESQIFECLSDQGLGPVCYYQNDKYRIEQSFDARPITIFEMRNPVFLGQLVEKTFKLNYNTKLREVMITLQGENAPTQIEILRDEWIPKLQAKFEHLYELIEVDEYKEIMDLVKGDFIREDIADYINSLSHDFFTSRDDLIVSHNDIQECNVLSMRHQSTDLAVIDYEYTSLGSREFDLANTFCELMLDNSAPYFPFIKLYPENCLNEEEFHKYAKQYLGLYHENYGTPEETRESYIEKELPTFLENLYCSMILDSYYWGVWSILMIDEKKINDKIFNFNYAKCRMDGIKHLLGCSFIREAIENKQKNYTK